MYILYTYDIYELYSASGRKCIACCKWLCAVEPGVSDGLRMLFNHVRTGEGTHKAGPHHLVLTQCPALAERSDWKCSNLKVVSLLSHNTADRAPGSMRRAALLRRGVVSPRWLGIPGSQEVGDRGSEWYPLAMLTQRLFFKGNYSVLVICWDLFPNRLF